MTNPIDHHLPALPARPLAASLFGAAFSAAALGTYSHWVEPYWLDVTRTEIPLPGLAAELDRLVLAQVSDLHLPSQLEPRSAARRAADAINQARPDLVVLTGDYGQKRASLDAFSRFLDAIRVRPAYAVFGNHDYRFGPAFRRGLERALVEHDVTLLDNRAVAFERNGAKLWIVGVGDAYTSHDRLGEALAGLSSADRPRILLTHYPDLLHDVSTEGFDLALAGHSHGEQIALPILGRRALAKSDTCYSRGLFRVKGVPLYVNRGLGTTRWRLRFRARPELALITLRAPAAVDGGRSVPS